MQGVDLRIMKQFAVEDEYILMPGDMLYLPPHVGHHGVSLDDECMTYSFGYRSYQSQELWDSFGDYLSEHNKCPALYKDPDWSAIKATSAISSQAVDNAKQLLQQLLNDENMLQSWFGCFTTRLDQQAEQHMPLSLEENECGDLQDFINELLSGSNIMRDSTCRIAYFDTSTNHVQLFINGCEWDTKDLSIELIKLVANHRLLDVLVLEPFLNREENQLFLYELWKLQWLVVINP